MIQAILTFPVLLLSLYGTGEWLRNKFLGTEQLWTGRIARALALGIITHGLLMTLLGFLFLLRPPVAALLTVLPTIIFFRIWWRDISAIIDVLRRKPSQQFLLIEILLLALIVLLLLLRAFNALAPNISWDATSHHYLVPSIWLKSGCVSDIPSIVFSYYPSLIDTGIAGSIALGTDILANLYGWIFGLLAALLLISIPLRYFDHPVKSGTGIYRLNRFSGILAAFIFLILPGVGVQTSGGYVDLPLACFTLLTLDFIFQFWSMPTRPVLILAAISAGAVLSTKHLGILLYAGFLIFLFSAILANKEKTDRLTALKKYLPQFVLISILIPAPWYIRSTVLTGNPFYPFGFFGLPTPPHPPFTPSSWIRLDYHRSIIGFLTYWHHLAFAPDVREALGRNYSIAYPILIPIWFLFKKLPSHGKVLAVLAGFSILVIYALFPVETRYHLPFLAPIALTLGILFPYIISEYNNYSGRILLALGTTATAIALVSRQRTDLADFSMLFLLFSTFGPLLATDPRKLFKSLTVFLIFLSLVSVIYDFREDISESRKRYKTILNLEPEDKYLLRESPFNYGTIHHINNKMDFAKMHILALENRLYRLKASWVTWFGLKESVVPTTPEENVAVWYRGGFTHVLLGDDVVLKALMYFNIVHHGGWDLPGASPSEMVEYIRKHPEFDIVQFRLQDLWINFAGQPFDERANHFKKYWLPSEIKKERYPIHDLGGETWYTASRLQILTDPIRLAQYSFVRGFRELVASGGLKIVYTDGLTFLFETDYPAYLKSHPHADLEKLGLK